MIGGIAVLLLVLQTAAETPAAATPGQDQSAAYRVGPGDVLEVSVAGNPELSQRLTVQPGGLVAMPFVGDVPVGELTKAEIERKLTNLLVRDVLPAARVEVIVVEYRKHFVDVAGEVNAGGRKPLRGPTRLVDVLIEAGGFTPRASGEVIVERLIGTYADGTQRLRVRFRHPLSPEDEVNLGIRLEHGDVVTALATSHITLQGEVTNPGRQVLEEGLTVMSAISGAGGLTRFAGKRATIKRIDGSVLEVDLRAIEKGTVADVALAPGDVVDVAK